MTTTTTTRVTRIGLRWLLTGGAFLTVLSLAGCSRLMSIVRPSTSSPTSHEPAPTAVASAKTAKPTPAEALTRARGDETDDAQADAAVPAPTVNVFGELDGVRNTRATRGVAASGFQQHTF